MKIVNLNKSDEKPLKLEYNRQANTNTHNNLRDRGLRELKLKPAYNKSISVPDYTISSQESSVQPRPVKRQSSLKKILQKQYNFLKKPLPGTSFYNYVPPPPQSSAQPLNRAKLHRLSLARRSSTLAENPSGEEGLPTYTDTNSTDNLNRRSSLSTRRSYADYKSRSSIKRVAFASNVMSTLQTEPGDIAVDSESRLDEFEKTAYKFDFEKNAIKFDFEKSVEKFDFEDREQKFDFEKGENLPQFSFEKKEVEKKEHEF